MNDIVPAFVANKLYINVCAPQSLADGYR